MQLDFLRGWIHLTYPRYNNKPLSLSQQIRHVNLPQGARLELVQASRSPTVISVALSLPASERNARLIQKFASNTSLWELLRQFESAQGANYNFTQRGVPEMNGTGTGAGRLNYEMPVVTVMPGHKEYGTFVDLQKTLSQLGFDSGSASLRLNFKNSGTPLEEAMAQISQYFKSVDPARPDTGSESFVGPTNISNQDSAASMATAAVPDENIRPKPQDTSLLDAVHLNQDVTASAASISTVEGSVPVSLVASVAPSPPPTDSAPVPEGPEYSPQLRNIEVFAAPTSSTPQAARTPFNEIDYQPSVEQLRGLQASYRERSKNTRLLSDKELEDQENSRKEKLAATANKGGIVRVRLPDGAMVQFPVFRSDTAATVYSSVLECLQYPGEPFQLSYRDSKGHFAQIPRNEARLFQDLNFSKNELLTFRWDEDASASVRGVNCVLSQEWTQKAAPLKVVEPTASELSQPSSSPGQTLDNVKPRKEYSAAEKENKLKSLLGKGLFKKK